MYTLILLVYAGMFSSGDSVAVTNVTNFSTLDACRSAGKQAEFLVKGTKKETSFVCVKQ